MQELEKDRVRATFREVRALGGKRDGCCRAGGRKDKAGDDRHTQRDVETVAGTKDELMTLRHTPGSKRLY